MDNAKIKEIVITLENLDDIRFDGRYIEAIHIGDIKHWGYSNHDFVTVEDFWLRVKPEGNILARKMLEQAFSLQSANWRGLGMIPQSGFTLKEELSDYDAAKRFRICPGEAGLQNGCRCGDVITGKLRPRQCPLFEKVCTPEDPVGPCMVSSEGACAAAYKYQS